MAGPDTPMDKVASPRSCDRDDLALLIAAATAAGHAALAHFRPAGRTSATVTMKAGDSPVTEADHAANAVLQSRLLGARPQYGWLSEETPDDGSRRRCDRVFVVDPIDGTKGFIEGSPYWVVSVAVVEAGQAVAGVIHAPALGTCFAAATGKGATFDGQPWRLPAARLGPGSPVAGPAPMVQRLEGRLGHRLNRLPRVASLAYRLMQAARGEAMLALALPDAHDWDVAAAAVILAEAGGLLLDATGATLRFDRQGLRHGALVGGEPDATRWAAPLLDS